ncbi:16S rRNA (cytosine(967)-C(5))-methyltransferase [Hahella sp. CCB-MM4]|uniref:16S rRNA (cytosine(967)-C(5))-methyltransferase RsmB n=1 Tax=Hahella sp. (strain CCB-MM4) TaxID=1926491 RepID=UPI000B9A2A13|nr:16S rRNA (cytosine(967)-C(5))-methyltransferase RsmB [Hahella sp. CCB-MM4]OZG73255.1 16S rRNA (cytosine(967)-C(5))-methyltransferase [Hahella sp. CCB-MM4]
MNQQHTAKSSRAVAVEILLGTMDEGKSLTVLMDQWLEAIPDNEKAFVSALCYGAVRWYTRLNGCLGQLLSKPLKPKDRDLHMLLVCGLYQLGYMQKPTHAVINETVNICRELNKDWATKLVNGVLRNYLRRKQELSDWADQRLTTKYGFPGWLVKSLTQAYPDSVDKVLDSLNQQAPMTLRVNQMQQSREEYAQQLSEGGIASTPTQLAPQGLTLATPCDVHQLPGFFDSGLCSVQDEAAQLAAILLDLKPGQRVLDACSAPGGKTAAILEQCPELASVTAVDLEADRQQRTRETLSRLHLEAKVVVADTGDLSAWWDNQPFDRILLDAPCSATGVIRRHPDIKHLRRQSDIAQLSTIQFRLLSTLWKTLAPGGRILYATCSILPQENTHIIERFIRETPDARSLPLVLDGSHDAPAGQIQLLPEPRGHDGFFYALLEKTTG